MKKKVYLIPNVITAFALSIGLFVIFKASLADPTRDLFSVLQASVILLLIAAVADVADGAIARWIHAESEFGGQFDSLSDSVSFGVAPPLLVLKSLTMGDLGRSLTFFVIVAAMLYTLCGILRLVRFNLRSRALSQNIDPQAALEEKKHFTGLPIPAAASAVLSMALVLASPYVVKEVGLSLEIRAWILIAVCLIIGYLMVSRWKFPSLKAFHFRVRSFYLIFATGIIAVLLLYGILDFFPEVFLGISWIYVIIGWCLSFIRFLTGKHSKKLADFEPASHDEEE